MKFEKAARYCHVRGYIARDNKPDKKYAKNHELTFEERIPFGDRIYYKDWGHHDPEAEETSIIG